MREGPAGPVCRAQRCRMPFLHGFRRITLEYQPLVDEILALLALQDAERQDTLER